jgi:phage terminase small subunit|tara:strand:- start:998 stop:1402 length:405 start_codon:yes stop_codon:yes gene_type:complete
MRTEKQESFIEAYCQTGNATKAAIQAGYSETTSKQQGHVLKNKFAKEIEQRIKKMVQDAVPAAVSQISILAQTATSEQVRLNASKDILDRAGLKPADRIEQRISHDDKSMDELKRELEALTGVTEIEEIPELVN